MKNNKQVVYKISAIAALSIVLAATASGIIPSMAQTAKFAVSTQDGNTGEVKRGFLTINPQVDELQVQKIGGAYDSDDDDDTTGGEDDIEDGGTTGGEDDGDPEGGGGTDGDTGDDDTSTGG